MVWYVRSREKTELTSRREVVGMGFIFVRASDAVHNKRMRGSIRRPCASGEIERVGICRMKRKVLESELWRAFLPPR